MPSRAIVISSKPAATAKYDRNKGTILSGHVLLFSGAPLSVECHTEAIME